MADSTALASSISVDPEQEEIDTEGETVASKVGG